MNKFNYLFLLTLVFINNAYADKGLNNPNNPFSKPQNSLSLPTNLPNQLGNNLPLNIPRGLPTMIEEPNEQIFDWNNLKVIGYINNHIILRIYNKNPQIEPKTILTDFDTKFLLNKTFYTIKNNNKNFTIFNNNHAIYRLNFESSPTHIIQRNNSNTSNSSNATNTNVTNNGNQGIVNGNGK